MGLGGGGGGGWVCPPRLGGGGGGGDGTALFVVRNVPSRSRRQGRRNSLYIHFHGRRHWAIRFRSFRPVVRRMLEGADALLPHMKADTALAGSERAVWE